MSNTCFVFHKWSKWADVQEKSLSILVQEKRCERCGKCHRRQTRWMGGNS